MSKVNIQPLDSIFSNNEQKRSFLYGVATYLKRLNTFASSKKTPNLIEYNVGGVISIVEQLETLAETFRPESLESQVIYGDDHVKILNQSWFCYEDSKDQSTEVTVKDHFNSNYDHSGNLPLRIGQFLLTLEPAINTYKYEMFKVSYNLLARYSNYIKKGEPIASVDPTSEAYLKDQEELSDKSAEDLQGLMKAFKTLYRMTKIDRSDNFANALEHRKKGNDLMKKKRLGAAIAEYTEAITLDSGNHVLYSNRGAIYTLLDDPRSAIEDFDRAVVLEPEYETAWTRLAFSYLTIGDAVKSVQHYSKSIKLATDKKLSPQYIQKLCSSLDQAEARARTSGTIQHTTIYTEPIQEIRNTYAPQQRGPQGQQGQGPTGNTTQPGLEEHLGTLFQQFRGPNENGSNDPLVTTLNGIGTIFGANSFQMFGTPNNAPANNENTNGDSTQNREQTAPQPQTSNDPIPTASSNSAVQDPESIILESNETPINQPQQQQQQQQRPQGLADLIQNALPEGLRNTIGPAIRMAISSSGNNQFVSPSPGGGNGGITFTTITTGPNGEVIPQTNNVQGSNQDTDNSSNNNSNATQRDHEESFDNEDFDLD